MKKNLLVLSLAAALPLAVQAQTSSVIYGDIELGVLGNKTFSGDGEMKTINRIDDSGSFLGFRGTEALGNGLNALWQIESYISADGTTVNGDDDANRLASRDTFLGLQGGWGTLRLGHLSDYMNGDMATMDSWTYSPAGVGGMSIMTRFDSRYGNAARYDMPTLAGFDLSLLYSADEIRDGGNNQFVWGVGAGYAYEPFFVKAGYLQFQEQNGSGNKDGNYWRIEGGYEGPLSIIGAFQQSRQYGAAATADTNNVWGRSTGDYGVPLGGSTVAFGDDDKLETLEAALTVSYEIGNFLPRASFVWGDDVKVNGTKLNDSGYQQYIVGVDYTLSKRSMLYASYGYVSYDGKVFADGFHDNEYTFALGVKHVF